jgi:transcriptional regulator with XRE-family HTH domain
MAAKSAGELPPSGFGPKLREVREQKGLTQSALATAAGVHANTVARMERGEVEPSWQMVLALAAALGVNCTAFGGPLADERPSKNKK